ncbi:MAG: hypothetical protein R3E31_04210 [Chloroflexota bacterium]
MDEQETTITDQILDLLLQALQQRQQQQSPAAAAAEVVASLEAEEEVVETAVSDPPFMPQPDTPALNDIAEQAAVPEWVDVSEPILEPDEAMMTSAFMDEPLVIDEFPIPEPEPPKPLPSIHLDKMLSRLALGLALLLVIVNIPFNRYGTNLARAMPDTAALIIRDGLLLKGSDDKVYVLENNKLRWITTLDAFEVYGYRWEQVHEVDDPFLAEFEQGLPIHLLLKCQASPHIYALENGAKRWIKDIPTFEAQGYVWENVRMTGCDYLRNLPDGPPIPLDAGTPPQP